MYSRQTHPVQSTSRQTVHSYARFVGAGAGAPTLKATGDGSGADQMGVSATRSAAGIYVFTLLEMPAVVLDVFAHVLGTIVTDVKVSAYSKTAKTVTVLCEIGAGTDTDLTTNDEIVITVVGKNTTA